MLTLTENACTIVKQITEGPDVPDSAGLRITEAEGGFAVTATSQPESGDQTVEQDGATVYLESSAAERLDTMVLDAGVDDAGGVQFGLATQGA
ncbi:Fe-S cluster assembly protein HesB [Nocardioides caeni]|uniref:Fe-S cluster assembly protein HesB n=1 Tax=Nocardioides caeni TaxID=574700 RepID=A0A4V6T5S9_9ACTN|nr:Fe-S cluster assembly protein HesB [Nocardioides caeni]THV08806.1 Fe-S cluster assembly protein HesB [Nocardioides caeni]